MAPTSTACSTTGRAVWLSPEFAFLEYRGVPARLECPTLVIQGEDDEYGTAKQVKAIARALGESCEVLMVPDCRHAPHADQRAAVEEAMVRFIATASGFRLQAEDLPAKAAKPRRLGLFSRGDRDQRATA